MVMHKKHEEAEPHYAVTAKVCEPDYAAEFKYLNAELAIVRRKIAEHAGLSVPKLGFFGHHDWRHYAHKLEHYREQLTKYRDEVEAGVLPVKFSVFNTAELPDMGIHVSVRVKAGRIDTLRKAPERPERLDAREKPLKFSLKLPAGFSRDKIKIAPHSMTARFSRLGAEDGAVLVNKLVHIHCGPHTEVAYQVSSRNVAHEAGYVELETGAPAQALHSPASSI